MLSCFVQNRQFHSLANSRLGTTDLVYCSRRTRNEEPQPVSEDSPKNPLDGSMSCKRLRKKLLVFFRSRKFFFCANQTEKNLKGSGIALLVVVSCNTTTFRDVSDLPLRDPCRVPRFQNLARPQKCSRRSPILPRILLTSILASSSEAYIEQCFGLIFFYF